MNIKKIKIALWILTFIFIGFTALTLIQGFHFTNVNNTFAWGGWFWAAQFLAAIGDGSLIIAFLFYIFRVDSLKQIVKPCILLSLIANLFVSLFLLLNMGQPLRVWFMIVNPTWGQGVFPVSLFTAAFFSMFIYLLILCLELVPVALTHERFEGRYTKTAHYMNKLVWILAAAAAFFAFIFHGVFGGGIFGSFSANSFWHREYFTLVLVAIAATGTGGMLSSLVLFTMSSKITGKEIISEKTFTSLSAISKKVFIVYCILRIADLFIVSLTAEIPASYIWGGYYGWPILIIEFGLVIAALVLIKSKEAAPNDKHTIKGAVCGLLAIIAGKVFIILQGFSIPNFPWEEHAFFYPSIIEVLVIAGAIACMVLIFTGCVKRFDMREL